MLNWKLGYISLGTSSAAPTATRNVSGAALRWGTGAVWLVDCGEATQHQLQRCSVARTRRVSCILITHMHGDHTYGLPGMLCSMSATGGHLQVLRQALVQAVAGVKRARAAAGKEHAVGDASGTPGDSMDPSAGALHSSVTQD